MTTPTKTDSTAKGTYTLSAHVEDGCVDIPVRDSCDLIEKALLLQLVAVDYTIEHEATQ
jgi:hypothetical protein